MKLFIYLIIINSFWSAYKKTKQDRQQRWDSLQTPRSDKSRFYILVSSGCMYMIPEI